MRAALEFSRALAKQILFEPFDHRPENHRHELERLPPKAGGCLLKVGQDDKSPQQQPYVTLFRIAPISVCEKALRVWVR
jgi:hypothetical protein